MQAERAYAAVERAAAYMNQRLGESDTPSLEELADVACLSKFHFHRLYVLITGESCSETMQRLRLARASGVLARGGTVTEAALIAGYSSSQALAKAFQKTVGTTASQLRQSPDRLATTIQKLGTTRVPGTDRPVAIELASLDPFTIVAVRTEGQYQELAGVYTELQGLIGGPGNIQNIFGVTMNNVEDWLTGGLIFECGFQVQHPPSSLPPSVHHMNLGGGQFLVARHVGCFSRLEETMDSLYWGLLQAPRLAPADLPTFMHYLDDPEHTASDALRTDIYLPVEPEDYEESN